MYKIATIIIFIFLIGCDSGSYDMVSRKFKIERYYPEDSIFADTLFFKNAFLEDYKPVEGLSLIYRWDSVLSRSRTSTKEIKANDSLSLEVLDTFKIQLSNKLVIAIEYLAIQKVAGREFDSYGIFVEQLGTIYFRGYHSKKKVQLSEASSQSIDWVTPKNIETLTRFVNDSILSSKPLTTTQKEVDEEIEEEIEIDFSGEN